MSSQFFLTVSLAHHVGLHKLALSSFCGYFAGNGIAHFFLSSEDYNLCSLECEVFGDAPSEDACAAGDYYYVVFYVE